MRFHICRALRSFLKRQFNSGPAFVREAPSWQASGTMIACLRKGQPCRDHSFTPTRGAGGLSFKFGTGWMIATMLFTFTSRAKSRMHYGRQFTPKPFIAVFSVTKLRTH